jgi:radical SAM superfamily enzyme YgiQ (UPF0313 family)
MIETGLSDVPWQCATRSDLVNFRMLKMMRRAGCVRIFFGFESGNQRILDILKKGTSVEQNKKVIKLCKKVGIKIYGSFIIGNPTETLEEIEATERFIEENDIDGVGVSIGIPYPGTKFYEWARERDMAPREADYPSLVLGLGFPASDEIPRDVLKMIYTKLSVKCALKNYGKLRFIKQYVKNPGAIFKYALKVIKR